MLKPLTKQLLKLVLISTALMGSFKAFALSSDVEKPVNIEADSAEFSKKAGTAVYAGSVIITQGTLEIRASRITIQAPNSEIQTITAAGRPVTIKQRMDDGRWASGQGNQMIYQVKKKLLVLNGNARLIQNKDSFTSSRIEYSTSTGQLRAGTAAAGVSKQKPAQRGRVRAVFHPTNRAR